MALASDLFQPSTSASICSNRQVWALQIKLRVGAPTSPAAHKAERPRVKLRAKHLALEIAGQPLRPRQLLQLVADFGHGYPSPTEAAASKSAENPDRFGPISGVSISVFARYSPKVNRTARILYALFPMFCPRFPCISPTLFDTRLANAWLHLSAGVEARYMVRKTKQTDHFHFCRNHFSVAGGLLPPLRFVKV